MTAGVTNKGIKLYIGTTAANPATDTFTQIKWVESLGGLGVESPVIDATALEDTAREKLLGIADSGNIDITLRRVFTDAGQNALKAAAVAASDTPYNFYIQLDGVGASATDAKWSFKAIVPKFMDMPGDIDALFMAEAQIAITGAITYAEV